MKDFLTRHHKSQVDRLVRLNTEIIAYLQGYNIGDLNSLVQQFNEATALRAAFAAALRWWAELERLVKEKREAQRQNLLLFGMEVSPVLFPPGPEPPMTKDEALQFREQYMPHWSKYTGELVRYTPKQHLAKLTDQNEFNRKLTRYVKSDFFAQLPDDVNYWPSR